MKIIALAIATSLLTGIFGIEKVEEEKVKIGTEIICEMSSEDIARIVVKAVIRTGRILVFPASTIASFLSCPSRRNWLI